MYEFRITDPDIRCCRIFRCAQQHVHIRQNNSLVAICAYGYVAARLLFRLICNLPEWRIRIFQSAYFLCPGCESEDIKVALSELN